MDLLELRRIVRIRRIERSTWDLTPSLVNQRRSWVVTYSSFGKLCTVTSTELPVSGGEVVPELPEGALALHPPFGPLEFSSDS